MAIANSKYMLIEQNILDQIKHGRYMPNEKIESENELCRIYDASRITVRKALDELCARNILYRKHGSGTFVQENASFEIERTDRMQIFVIAPNFSRLMSNVAQTYLPEIYENIDNERYSVNTLLEPAKEEHESNFIEWIQKQNAVGIIYYYFGRRELLDKLAQLQIPIVLVDIVPDDNPFDCVTGEDFESAYRATLSLLANGCSKIGFFSQFSAEMSTAHLREMGVRQALLDNGMTPDEKAFYHCEDGQIENMPSQDMIERAEKYLKLNEELDAVITANDEAAFSLIGSAANLKIRMPEDLKMISYGNFAMCSLPMINLTSYEQYLGRYAAEAAKLLCQRIEGKLPPIIQKRIIKYSLMKRRTF